jgi:hypothetical protein
MSMFEEYELEAKDCIAKATKAASEGKTAVFFYYNVTPFVKDKTICFLLNISTPNI